MKPLIFTLLFGVIASTSIGQAIYNYTHGNTFHNEFITNMHIYNSFQNQDGNLAGTTGPAMRLLELDGDEIYTVPLDLGFTPNTFAIHDFIQHSDGSYWGVGQVGTGNADGYIYKTDQFFQIQWWEAISGSKTESLDAVWELPNGDVMAIGWTLSDLPEIDSTITGKDLIMIRYSSSGEKLFSKKIGEVAEGWGLDQFFGAGPISDTSFAINLRATWSSVGSLNYEPNVVFLNNDGDVLAYRATLFNGAVQGSRGIQTDDLGYIYVFNYDGVTKFSDSFFTQWERGTDLRVHDGLVNDDGYLLVGYSTSLAGDFAYEYDFTAKTTENRYAHVLQHDPFSMLLWKFRPGNPGEYGDNITVSHAYGLTQLEDGTIYTSQDGSLVILHPCNMDVDFGYVEMDTEIQFYDSSSTNVVLWEWEMGDGSTSGSKNPSRAYAAAGAYEVCLTGTTADFCRLERCYWVPFQQGMGLGESEFEQVQLYPNPSVNGYLFAKGIKDGQELFLIDGTGRTVLSDSYSSMTGIDIQGLPNGNYQLMVAGQRIGKVVIAQ